MLGFGKEISSRIWFFITSDRGHKKSLHHHVKALSWQSNEDEYAKWITLDTDVAGWTSNKTNNYINISLRKLEISQNQCVITRRISPD